MPHTPLPYDVFTDDMVILVLDRTHPRFGQLAKVEAKRAQNYLVGFADGELESIPRLSSVMEDYYRQKDMRSQRLDITHNAGIESLKKRFWEVARKDVGRLEEEYHELFREHLE
ncbi:MAG: hypothetical protein AABW73_01335 [Nanoarchaeota archaeon]